METTVTRTGWQPLEIRTVWVGFLLAGLVLAVTTVSFALNTTFPYRWLVWGATVGFAAIALLALERLRAVRSSGELPEGGYRRFFLLAVPFAFVRDSFPVTRNGYPQRGFGLIANLMKACFPSVFTQSFCLETVRSRLNNVRKNEEAVAACRSFESIYCGISDDPAKVILAVRAERRKEEDRIRRKVDFWDKTRPTKV